MATKTVRVQAKVTRYIGDDHYAAGATYRMAAERAERYVALGDFAYLGGEPEPEPEPEPGEAKQAEPPNNKMRGRVEDKAGLPNRAGENVNLDGSPATGEGERP